MTIYFTSDLHLGHNAVLGMCQRPFKTIEEHDRALIGNINARVAEHDELFILGDVSYRISKNRAIELLSQVRCKNIHLVNGNHDKDWSVDDGVFKSVSDYVKLKYDGFKIVCMHYPLLEWDGSRYSFSYHLHGHQHNGAEYNVANIEAGVHRFDVGVDANDYKPVSLDEILSLFGAKASI